jgi:hypothetical protein
MREDILPVPPRRRIVLFEVDILFWDLVEAIRRVSRTSNPYSYLCY